MTTKIFRAALLISAAYPLAASAADQQPASPTGLIVTAPSSPQPEPRSTLNQADEDPGAIVVTARRREEKAQDVPIALSVLSNVTLQQQATFSIQQISQLAPTLQFSSSNPRNTSLNIRGLGASVGLTNDGLEQGVGFYVDGVYTSRPAAAALDLTDVERVEVLRGPQGTLFGKNTTAGALNITTMLPSFTPEGQFEASIGDHQFVQVKAGVSAPFSDTVAGRIALGYTSRDGFITSTKEGHKVNDLDNLAARAQFLWKPTDTLSLRLIGDYNLENPDCCTQVAVAVGSTLKTNSAGLPAKQFAQLAAQVQNAAGITTPYFLPGGSNSSPNPYARIADFDGQIRARSAIGGLALNADLDLGGATLTSITAWRWWDWQPRNDRDYTSLDILRASSNFNQQDAYSQEFRISSNGKHTIDYTAGVFAYYQDLRGQNLTIWGRDAAYWLIGKTTGSGAGATNVPYNFLDGYTQTSSQYQRTWSYAAFGQATWNITPTLRLTPGLRYTQERKRAQYDALVSGGPAISGLLTPAQQAALASARKGIAGPQSYPAGFNDGQLTGDINLAWKIAPDILVYGGYSRGYKSGGINLAGVPNDATGAPALSLAVVKPERVDSYEAGLKTQFFNRKLTANLAIYRSDVTNYQANVVDTGPGSLRPYLANAAKVRSQGVEFDFSTAPMSGFTSYLRGAYTDAKYIDFKNAPCPLERVGNSTSNCDLSGQLLPNVSKWALSAGGEYRHDVGSGDAYVGVDANYRSSFFGDASDSAAAKIPGYTVVNARIGFASRAGWEVFGLVRNIFNKDYLLLTTLQSGNSGLVTGIPGDPRTFQITARYRFGS